jgi:hypothetical protein
VAAALGALDAMDVLSISNEPDEDWSEWYDLLSAGLDVTPTAGTDAVLNWFNHAPPGIWRVYAHLGSGQPLDYAAWLDAVRQGRTFVTNLPLITEFTVSGRRGGEILEVPGDSLIAQVRIRASCAIGFNLVKLVADGATVWSRAGTASAIDTTFTLRIATPAWIAARVEGAAGHPVSLIARPIAHTNAVRITRNGIPRRRRTASARWLVQLERLENLLSPRSWPAAWQRDTVFARIGRARDYYGIDFPTPPGPVTLVHPARDGVASTVGPPGLRWTRALDPDAGDSISYTLRIATDSTLAGAWKIRLADTTLTQIPLSPNRWYWWAVEAFDLARRRAATFPVSRFWLASSATDVPTEGATSLRPRAVPTPSAGPVRLLGLGPDASVYDLSGRRIAWLGRGIERDGDALVWDGTSSGRPAPAGVYCAVSGRGRGWLKVVRIAP